MRPESLAECIEKAFGGLNRPSYEEMPVRCSDDEEFIWAVESKTWQELRPLHQYLSSGQELLILSAKAYQYYIPAFLYALIDETGDDLYLGHVLKSLWYENTPARMERVRRLFRVPPGGWEELMPEIEKQFSSLTYEERRTQAEVRIRIAEKMAKVSEMTGRDWGDIPLFLHKRWEERMALLTDNQKRCIALSLVHILERSNPGYVSDIQTALDKYWRAFLAKPGNL